MSGRFQQNVSHGPSAKTQSDASVIAKHLTANSAVVTPSSVGSSFAKMPVTTSTLSQVLRMPSFHDLQSLPSLHFSVASSSPSYVFSDNGFDSSPQAMYSKQGKGGSPGGDTLSHQPGLVRHQSVQRPLSRPTPVSVPSPRSPYSPAKDDRGGGSPSFQGSRNEFDRTDRSAVDKPASTSSSGAMGGPVMLINVPPYHENGTISRSETRPSPSFTSGSVSSGTMALTNHHPVLRYPPNGDALLSTSAISYGDGEMLPEGGFDVHMGNSLGSLEDGLLSGNLGVGADGTGGNSGFDLFDGEPRQEPFLNEGNQDVQLSSQTFPSTAESFGLSDSGSNLSSLQDAAPDVTISGENVSVATKCSSGSNTSSSASKLAVTTILDKVKAKSRPTKAVSPNRTTTQTCPVCGKVFSNSSALAKHKLTHSDERKYVCQLCTKAFKRQDHLNGHLLTHMNKKPYECKVEGCGKSYCDARSLRRHTENHHSSTSQASVVAAAAAVNAITVRVGGVAAAAAAVQGTLPFGAERKIEPQRTGFLAMALQSDRIRYAPAQPLPTAGGSQLPPYSTPTSGTTSSVPSSSVGKLPLTTTSSSSAASQLQMLAFQQQGQQQSEDQDIVAWKRPNVATEDILFGSSSSLRTQLAATESKQPAATAQQQQYSSLDQPTSQAASVPEGYLGQATSQANYRQANGSDHQLPISGIFTPSTSLAETLSASFGDALRLRTQWPKNVNSYLAASAASASFISEPKPVECNICQRKFKNIPALNGHMRLHGGYLKKDVDPISKKPDKKTADSRSQQPPLQTASVSIRALIEEKIIQRRIVNPPLSATTIPPPPPSALLPATSLPHHALPSALVSSLQHRGSFVAPLPPSSFSSSLEATGGSDLSTANHDDELLAFADSCMKESPILRHLPQQQHHHHHHHLLQVPMEEESPSSPLRTSTDSCLQEPELMFQEQHQDLDSDTDQGGLGAYHRASEDDGGDDDAQSDMQRQIEIIKQGLMSHQPPLLEKFRRHSDSDHFLAPRSYHLGSLSPSSVADFLRRKVSGKRTQRTGSDPGEFTVGNLEEMLSGTLVEMDECSPAAVDDDGGLHQMQAEAEDLMEFEIESEDEAFPTPPPPLPGYSVCRQSPEENAPVVSSVPTSCPVPSLYPDVAPPVVETTNYDGAPVSVPVAVTIPKVKLEEDDDVFLSPSSIPTSPIRTKKKHRPEPLYIPPHASTCGFQSRLRSPRLWDSVPGGRVSSPPPYTPPPMLSPVRSAPGLFWHVINNSGSLTPKSAPLTPGKLAVSQEYMYMPDTEEEEVSSDPPETDILPHVNIGSQFQAALPVWRGKLHNYDRNLEDLIWDPKCTDNLSDKEVEMYLEFACCAAIPGGGRNKEYALHVLHLHGGNLQEAMLSLMDPTPKLQETHPLLEYRYAESDRWSTEEIELYHQALLQFDKDFFSIAQEVKTKNVKQCIQFYYLWKKICPDEYKRLRTIRRKRELEGGQYNLRSKLGDDGNDAESSRSGDSSPPLIKTCDATERFLCDFPDCLATFTSRQALNGHIRIHGGNTSSKGSFGHRSRSPASNAEEFQSQQNSAANHSTGSNALIQFGEAVEEFPCKICGKVFFKVKSRSAHMKSHRPVDPDRHK